HPGVDEVVSWTPDGKSILFRSNRISYSPRYTRLFTVPLEGGFPSELPLPMGSEASFSPDGTRLAYMPIPRAFEQWKKYRGGQMTKIWLARLSESSTEEIPRQNSNDFNPMWVGNKIYFLSDRNGGVSLFSYDLSSKKVSTVVQNDGFDIKSASAGADAIVYDKFGTIYLLDLKSNKPKRLEITVEGD